MDWNSSPRAYGLFSATWHQPMTTSGLNRIPASANLLLLSEYAGTGRPFFDIPDMRKAYRYKIVSSQRLETVEKDVNVCLEQFGYDLYGSPFSRGDEYVQALVKSEDVPATDVPSTLRPAVRANLDQPN